MKRGKEFGLFQILDKIKSGKNPSQITKDYNISKQKVNYYIGKLKQSGCIEKIGYGTWEFKKDLEKVKIQPKGTIPGQKQIRGHAFIWKIEFFDNLGWPEIINNYKKKNLTFYKICNGQVFRTIFNNRKIWLTKNGMVIYEPLDYLGYSSFQVKGTAVFEMDKLVKDFLRELNIKFRPYRFTTSREHYGIIKNQLAKQYNDRKEKLYIRGQDGTVWLWIDDSLSLGELENNNALVNRQVQTFWNDHKKHKFEVNASMVLNNFQESAKQIKANADNLEFHADNMRSHVKATQDLSNATKLLNSSLERQEKILTDLLKAINSKL